MIKYLKWLKLVPSSNGSSEEIAYAFLDRVFNRFDVPTNVFIDRGMKFHGEFQKICPKSLIYHCTTSQDHPKHMD
jgi:hypothetical protein